MTLLAPPLPPAPHRQLVRFSVSQYHDLLAAGVLNSGDRIELIDGLLVEKMTKGPRHTAASVRIQRRLHAVPPGDFYIGSEIPISLPSENSEPEPDLSLVRGTIDDFTDRHPEPSDVLLLIEIADSSLVKDRRNALRYARAGVAHYLLVDMAASELVLHQQPGQDGYGDVAVVLEVTLPINGDTLTVLSLSDVFPDAV